MRLLLLSATAVLLVSSQTGRTVVVPEDTGAALRNPGMGWVLHHYDNSLRNYGLELAPSDTVDDFPGANVVYLRLAWSYLEPEEGKFNWAIVDTPAQRWIAKGRQVAFRFTCTESDRDQPSATPEWVRKAGARGHFFVPGRGVAPGGTHWEPDYDDPVFLAKLDHFLAAAAARYDGDSHVAFIDIGSFGTWGEGHTFYGSQLPYSGDTVRRHIDLYRKHFRRTLVLINDDHAHQGRGLEVIEYARRKGLGLRDDSILVEPPPRSWHSAYLAPLFWPTLPVIVESEHYGPSVKRGAWGDGSLYLKAIEEYHASYASVHWYPRQFLERNRDLIDRINRRLGYRLQLLEASWPAEVPAAGEIAVAYRWRNAGVAPCLPGGFPAITLKDEKGGIVAVFVDEAFDVRTLPVGAPGEALAVGREVKPRTQESLPLISFRLPPPRVLKPGSYSVYVSVGSRQGTPAIALPLAGEDGQRRYRLGSVRVTDAR